MSMKNSIKVIGVGLAFVALAIVGLAKSPANQAQNKSIKAAQAFSWPAWAQGSLPKDPEPIRVVRFTGGQVNVFCCDNPDPNYPNRLPILMVPRTLQPVPGLNFSSDLQAKAWVLANMPPVAPFTKWIWTPLNDVGTMVR